jgi:hypothetical protein
MEAQNSQYFRIAFFKFSIRIPLNWRFTNPAWSPIAQLKNSSDSDEHWINQAGLPFCCAMQHHQSESHAYPTLQVSARPCKIPDNTTAANILSQQIQFINKQHEDFELIQSTSEAIVSGHRANLVRATFSFSTMPNNEVVKFNILARTYTIFTPGIAFTIGLSSSNDNKYFNEADFNAIISSVRIGT